MLTFLIFAPKSPKNEALLAHNFVFLKENFHNFFYSFYFLFLFSFYCVCYLLPSWRNKVYNTAELQQMASNNVYINGVILWLLCSASNVWRRLYCSDAVHDDHKVL